MTLRALSIEPRYNGYRRPSNHEHVKAAWTNNTRHKFSESTGIQMTNFKYQLKKIKNEPGFRNREVLRTKASTGERQTSLVSNRLSIKLSLYCFLAVLALAVHLEFSVRPADAADKRPIPLVFDTDIGNDIDDALALGVIHALVSRGECELLAVTISKDHPLSAPFVDAVNTFYGRGEIPIGAIRGGPTREPSKFTGLANVRDGDQLRYPHDLLSGADAPDAVTLLRSTLAAADDGAVVVVQVGFSTNLARLLKSDPDETCRLSGVDLVQKKVRLLSVMAGSFAATSDSAQPEYNVKMDIASAQTLVSSWPTPIVFSG